MKKSRFSDGQLLNILSSVTGRATIREVCQSHGVREKTFYTWRRKYAGMESDDIRKLKAHQSENQALKQIVAGQALFLGARVKQLRKNTPGRRAGARCMISVGASRRKACLFVRFTCRGPRIYL